MEEGELDGSEGGCDREGEGGEGETGGEVDASERGRVSDESAGRERWMEVNVRARERMSEGERMMVGEVEGEGGRMSEGRGEGG